MLMLRSSLAGAAAISLATGLAACRSTVRIDSTRVQARAFAAPIEKPRLLVTPLDVRDGSWRDASIYFASVAPELPEELDATLVQAARATNLFRDVRRVSWREADLAQHKGDLKPGDLLLAAVMPTCRVDGGMNPGGVALSVLTLGIAPLISLLGVPTLPYHEESDWRLTYRLIDAASFEPRLTFDSGSVRSNDANFTASWTNTPSYLAKMLEQQQQRILGSFSASFAPLAPEQRLKVDYPYETARSPVQIRVNVSEDPELRYVDIDVNERRIARHDLKAAPSTAIPLSVELVKGMNVIAIVAEDDRGEPVARMTITITRLK